MHRAMLLPAHAHLEHKLYAVDAYHWFGHGAKVGPDRHFDNAGSWLRTLGLEQVTVSAHICEYTQPLPDYVRRHLELTFTQYFGTEIEEAARQYGMSDDEWKQWLRLSTASSPEYILDRPDYRLVRMMTLTTGVVPGCLR